MGEGAKTAAGDEVAPVVQSADELLLARGMRVVGVLFSPVSLGPLIYGLQYGWAWKPWQHEQVIMIIAIYGVLAYFLVVGSYDLQGSKHLLNYTIWGACFAHGGLMLGQAMWSWQDEFHHVMPYGDVTVLLLLGGALLFLQSRAVKTA